MLSAFQARVEDQQSSSVFDQERAHRLDVRVVHPGRHADELIQAGRRNRERGRPERPEQQVLEALGTKPMPLRLVPGRYESWALLLRRVCERVWVLLVKGRQGFNRPLVSPFSSLDRRTDMKAIDMEPTELMDRVGQVGLHRHQVAGVHIGQAELDLLLEPGCRKVLEHLADGRPTPFAAPLQAQNQSGQRVHDHHAQYLAAQLLEEDFVNADRPRQGNRLPQAHQQWAGVRPGLGDHRLHIPHRDVNSQPVFQDFDDAAHRAAPRQLQHDNQAVLHDRPLRLQTNHFGFQGAYSLLGLDQRLCQALHSFLRYRVGPFHAGQSVLQSLHPLYQHFGRHFASANPHQGTDRQAQYRVEGCGRDPQGVRQRPYRLAFIPNEGPQDGAGDRHQPGGVISGQALLVLQATSYLAHLTHCCPPIPASRRATLPPIHKSVQPRVIARLFGLNTTQIYIKE